MCTEVFLCHYVHFHTPQSNYQCIVSDYYFNIVTDGFGHSCFHTHMHNQPREKKKRVIQFELFLNIMPQ